MRFPTSNGMKKQTIVVLVVILVAIIAGIIYISKGASSTPVANEDGTLEGKYSIEGIAALNKPYRCTFLKNDGASQVNGSITIAEGMVRGDFDIRLEAQDGGEFSSHFIMRDNVNYTWTSIQPIGFKSEIATNASKNASPEEQSQLVGTKEKVDYKCVPWNPNLTIFELPSGINFLDLK